jgi:hypothetical protein
MRNKKVPSTARVALAILVAVLAIGGLGTPAHADDRHHDRHRHYAHPAPGYAYGYAYQPPPVVYQPAPAPPAALNFVIPLHFR